MKKVFTIALVSLFTLGMSAETRTEIKLEKENLPLECREYVSVDCDGDGLADYEYNTLCEYADSLREQYQQACDGPIINDPEDEFDDKG